MKLCANLSFMFQEEEDLVARSVVILISFLTSWPLPGTGLLTRLASVQWRSPTLTMTTWRSWPGSSRRLASHRSSVSVFHLLPLILTIWYTMSGSAQHGARHQLWSRGPGRRGGPVPGEHEDLPGLLRGAGGQIPAHYGRQGPGGGHQARGYGDIHEEYQVIWSATTIFVTPEQT